MKFQRVVIIGPGLVGGSLGLAMKARGLAGHVVGVGHRQVSIDKAVQTGAVDSGSLDPVQAVKEADLVVVATAVGMIPDMVRRIAGYLAPDCIVTDVGSTKQTIVQECTTALGPQARFVGGHPIAGSDRRGIDHARADLFKGTVCVLTPVERTDLKALETVEGLWRAVGAVVHKLDPRTHDAILARTSHLPHVVAAALVDILESGDDPFVGTGFLDTTRIASGDPDLWVDILFSNRVGVTEALSKLGESLEELTGALKTGDTEAARRFLVRARDRRDRLNRPRVEES